MGRKKKIAKGVYIGDPNLIKPNEKFLVIDENTGNIKDIKKRTELGTLDTILPNSMPPGKWVNFNTLRLMDSNVLGVLKLMKYTSSEDEETLLPLLIDHPELNYEAAFNELTSNLPEGSLSLDSPVYSGYYGAYKYVSDGSLRIVLFYWNNGGILILVSRYTTGPIYYKKVKVGFS